MFRLVVTDDAANQIRSASHWWYRHRQASPGLFRSELRRAFEMILAHPGAGPPATNTELPGVRRVLLRKTRYHLYRRLQEDAVEILALWHTSRSEEPTLSV